MSAYERVSASQSGPISKYVETVATEHERRLGRTGHRAFHRVAVHDVTPFPVHEVVGLGGRDDEVATVGVLVAV